MARVQDSVRALKKMSYAETLSSIMTEQREIQTVENLLAQLDLSEHQELEQKLEDLKQQEQQWQQSLGSLQEEKGKLEIQIKTEDGKCKKLSDLQEKTQELVEQCEQNLRDIVTQWSEFDVEKKLEQADKEAKDLNEQIASNFRQQAETSLHELERKLAKLIQQHNDDCRPTDTVIYENYSGRYDQDLFTLICNVYNSWILFIIA